jgi:hypothetical protein
MQLRHSGLAALLVLACATLAGAQEVRSSRGSDAPAVNVERLPVNLARIQRALRQSAERAEVNGLNIRYVIDVYGTAPRIDVLDPKTDNLRNGPVPYGAPTHQQMLEIMTPQEFRAPVMDFGALMRWLGDRTKK